MVAYEGLLLTSLFFLGQLKVGLKKERQFQILKPNSDVELKVTGDEEATVGLVAVDKAVYVLNSKHKLTQKKVRIHGLWTRRLPRGSKTGASASSAVKWATLMVAKIQGFKELVHSSRLEGDKSSINGRRCENYYLSQQF